MRTAVKSVRVNLDTVAEIERLCQGRKVTFSALAGEMLIEAARMRRCPGIVFADGPTGRRARIEGTGIEVWELVAVYLALDRDEQRLSATFDWLTERQILAALGYYRAFPEEIDELVEANRDADGAATAADLPFARRLRP